MDLLTMTADLILAQIHQRNIMPETLDMWLRRTHDTLLGLIQAERTPRAALPPSTSDDWLHSIQGHSITCLVCNTAYKQLATRPLRKHGLTANEYRQRYGIPRAQPLSAKAVTARRSESMSNLKPWEKKRGARARKTMG